MSANGCLCTRVGPATDSPSLKKDKQNVSLMQSGEKVATIMLFISIFI